MAICVKNIHEKEKNCSPFAFAYGATFVRDTKLIILDDLNMTDSW